MELDAERRQTRRYPMDVPLRVGSEEGRTRDMSSRGVYFLSHQPIAMGAAVELDVTLTNACAQGPVSLHVRGRVTRVDQLEDELGLAVEIESWDVTDLGRPGFQA
jgi:hypothetical protein